MGNERGDFKSLDGFLGLEVKSVEIARENEEVHFILTDCRKIVMEHSQECCEDVYLAEVDTDLCSLSGIITKFEEAFVEISSEDEYLGATFYNIVVGNTSFNMRWCGSSNGYYSVSVCASLVE